MSLQRSMLFACCALLSACATTGPAATTTAARQAPTVAAAMLEADAAIKAGHNDQAYAILKKAGGTFPLDKTPWVRMAQMRFDSTDYGQAIVDALAALQRDPDDTLANRIVAVSGLRVTSRALAELSQKNNFTGNVRTEAQELAKLLRANLNEDALVAGTKPNRSAGGGTKRTTAPQAPAATGPKTTSSHPFGALK